MIAADDIRSIMLDSNLPVIDVFVPSDYPTSPIQVTYSRALTSGEQSTANAILALSDNEIALRAIRLKAINFVDNTKDQLADIFRAVIIRLVSELNLIRARLRAQDTAVQQATSLANLQSRWATAASANPMPDRTNQQARQTLQDDIRNALADS